uniref:Candidate secreted effector n=1 Tax=Meloidogyne incognita TaxID=6306 RepID=A0A914MMM5_MELIC
MFSIVGVHKCRVLNCRVLTCRVRREFQMCAPEGRVLKCRSSQLSPQWKGLFVHLGVVV